MLLAKPLYKLFSRVADQDKFYSERNYRISLVAGVAFYAAAVGCGAKMFHEFKEDWQYADLIPSKALVSGGMWGIGGAMLTYVGDAGFIYAYLNRRHRKNRSEALESHGENLENLENSVALPGPVPVKQ